MIIGSQVAEHSFWYNHGVELFGAIVTLLAFLLTFTNIKRTDKRLEKDEKKRNIKTLKMIDLSTHKERMSIQQWALMFKMENDVITQKKYNILFSNYNVNFETENKKAFIIGEIANKYKISDLEVELTHYLEIIKDNLNNNHVNLSLQSLKRITEKISYLNEAINYSKWFSDTEALITCVLSLIGLLGIILNIELKNIKK
ncbi:hypothetical protein PZJ39_07590 [Staphylococcus capitis]|nr:hypothetical protein [Staphylococcus capitis]MDH9629738.1 hypothetical protein [Staphylococcus capitis]MDH9966729.1 hypothetical protein [Staphylococcus capitis]MDH9978552.1 hypothetical protein [Staphylococcus capitis]MDH9980087.1 hypothetical protein [Staphylococcus capitis]MDI0031425.1 hypothetical protein [Staphylococcus capitis]